MNIFSYYTIVKNIIIKFFKNITTLILQRYYYTNNTHIHTFISFHKTSLNISYEFIISTNKKIKYLTKKNWKILLLKHLC